MFKKVEDIKVDEFVKFPKSNKVYIRKEYNKFIKKYELQSYDDINSYRSCKKGTILAVDFDF